MPNHVRNLVRMKGISRLPLYSASEEYGFEYFDFNKLIEMPEELNVTSGGREIDAINAVLAKIKMNCRGVRTALGMDAVKKNYEEIVTNCGVEEKQLLEEGLQYISNAVRFGATTWYDWCCNNWGTKWNAYDFMIANDDTIMFSTAWSAPRPIIAALARKYPDATIEHWWADEDMGTTPDTNISKVKTTHGWSTMPNPMKLTKHTLSCGASATVFIRTTAVTGEKRIAMNVRDVNES